MTHNDLPGLHAFSAPAYVPHRSGGEASLHLQADDRLLLVTDGNDALSPALPHPSSGLPGAGGQANSASQSADLRVIHLRLPAPYLAANWPLSHAALSSDGMDIAVAGRYGLALYSRRSAKWRLFGDVSQEREMSVHVRVIHQSSARVLLS